MTKNRYEYLDPQRDKVEKNSKLENAIEKLENLVPTLIRTDGLYDENSDEDPKRR